MKQNTNSTT